MDRFSKYIGKNARLKDGSLVTIIDVLEDDKSDKPLFYVKYDNGSVDSVYSNYIQNIIEDEPEVEDNEDINGDENIEDDGIDPVDVDNEDEMDEVEINNRIFSGESRMKKFNENYSVAELSDIFNNKQKRVQTMKDLADDDRMTGILLDFGGEVELEVTDVDDFVDAMILPFREALINKANSLIEENGVVEMKGSDIPHYVIEVEGEKPLVFIDYSDAVDYCDKKGLSYDVIVKTKEYPSTTSSYKKSSYRKNLKKEARVLSEGQFSWFTQDTGRQIGSQSDNTIVVTMFDNQGRKWVEGEYDGYGVFGGKDYYELLAEMNGYGSDRSIGISVAFGDKPTKNPDGITLYPALVQYGRNFDYKTHDFSKEAERDPNQGFGSSGDDGDDYDYYDEKNKTDKVLNNQKREGFRMKQNRRSITEGRATTFGFAGETIKVNDPVMDISTNRQGFVKSIHENGDAEIDFSGKKETHKIRTFMKI